MIIILDNITSLLMVGIGSLIGKLAVPVWFILDIFIFVTVPARFILEISLILAGYVFDNLVLLLMTYAGFGIIFSSLIFLEYMVTKKLWTQRF